MSKSVAISASFLLALAQPDAWSPAVLLDEFDDRLIRTSDELPFHSQT